jgi:hypothetical protein
MHEKRQELTLREHNVQGSKIERIDIQSQIQVLIV